MDKVFHSFALTNNLLLAVVAGTLIIGTGLAIVFTVNGSTGGTDILAKILNKYVTFNIGVSLLMVDLFVAVLGGLTFGLDKGIYSLVAIVINGLLVDKVIAKIEKIRDSKIDKKEVFRNKYKISKS